MAFFAEILLCSSLNNSHFYYLLLFRSLEVYFLCLLDIVIVIFWLVGQVVYIFQIKGLFCCPYSLFISNLEISNQIIFLYDFTFSQFLGHFKTVYATLSTAALSHLTLHH